MNSKVDWDDVFNEIGQFGRWQKLVFFLSCLCSMCSAFLTLSFSSFIGFTPKFRCFIPQCDPDDRDAAQYDANYTVFAIPPEDPEDDSLEDAQCKMYAYNSSAVSDLSYYDNVCSAEHFNRMILEICDHHVYDKSEYKNSFIAELDLSSCHNENDDWPLEERLENPVYNLEIELIFLKETV